MKIVVDAFGGDNAPVEIIKGCVNALNNYSELNVVLCGDDSRINAELKNYKVDLNRITVIHAPDVISNDESPTMAIKTKKQSSLVVAFDTLKQDDGVIGLVSAGSTGAVLTGGVLKIGRMQNVLRPALAPLLPTVTGGEVCLIDCGANVDCTPEFLAQFAVMGVSYMKTIKGIKDPRVALVSVGVEDHKGNAQSKATFELLKQLPINFVGNMEARDALSGDYDVLVCDGFVGNVLLKSVEGTALMVMKLLKNAVMESGSAKFGYLFMKKAFKKLKGAMDYNSKGGSPFLGANKLIVKAHGSSNAVSIEACIKQVIEMHKSGLIESLKSQINEIANKSEQQ